MVEWGVTVPLVVCSQEFFNADTVIRYAKLAFEAHLFDNQGIFVQTVI